MPKMPNFAVVRISDFSEVVTGDSDVPLQT
jgi:hypothetical protein